MIKKTSILALSVCVAAAALLAGCSTRDQVQSLPVTPSKPAASVQDNPNIPAGVKSHIPNH